MNEQTIRKNNMRIFPIYKMFAWDLLFHYAIIFLFLTQVKGFTASDVLFADSLYAIFRVFSQIFCVNIVDSLGKKNSLLLGDLLVSISTALIIMCKGLAFLLAIYFIEAIGYNLKGLCESTILADSIPKSSSSAKIYSKINGKGSSYYYIFDAISATTTGFLYVINPYIPMILSFVCCLISTVISLAFTEPISNNDVAKDNHVGFIAYYKDIFITFKKILKSNRLKSLLIFSGLFFSILCVFATLKSSILVDLGVPEQYFGIILAVAQIISSISSGKQQWFHNKLRNKTLTWFSLSISIGFILTGLLVVCNISFLVSISIVFIMIILHSIVRGPYFTLDERYLNSFSNPTINSKIFAIKQLLENMGRFSICLLSSLLLKVTNTANTFIIIGTLFFTIFIFLLSYMKSRVGLKPEEYPKEDLIFSTTKDSQ